MRGIVHRSVRVVIFQRNRSLITDKYGKREPDPSIFFFYTDRSAVKETVPKGTKALYGSHWLWSHLGGITERP